MAQRRRTAGGMDDELLLDCLARALDDTDGPPPSVEAAARELLTWRTVDAELAALLSAARTPAATD